MQDKYAGDIGDFGKLGLLRALAKTGLSIGVNWYHTYPTPKESSGGDGRFTEYLKDDSKEKEMYISCDEELWSRLKEIVESQQRFIYNLEHPDLIPAVYWSKKLDYEQQKKDERTKTRSKWHNDALDALKGQKIVFLDPDNGLIVRSAKKTPRDKKYVLQNELSGYYNKSSVIYYQHKARMKDEHYLNQHRNLLRSGKFPGATGLCLKFKKTSLRYYFFIIRPEHKQIIEECIDEMLKSPWGFLFKQLDF